MFWKYTFKRNTPRLSLGDGLLGDFNFIVYVQYYFTNNNNECRFKNAFWSIDILTFHFRRYVCVYVTYMILYIIYMRKKQDALKKL